MRSIVKNALLYITTTDSNEIHFLYRDDMIMGWMPLSYLWRVEQRKIVIYPAVSSSPGDVMATCQTTCHFHPPYVRTYVSMDVCMCFVCRSVVIVKKHFPLQSLMRCPFDRAAVMAAMEIPTDTPPCRRWNDMIGCSITWLCNARWWMVTDMRPCAHSSCLSNEMSGQNINLKIYSESVQGGRAKAGVWIYYGKWGISGGWIIVTTVQVVYLL